MAYHPFPQVTTSAVLPVVRVYSADQLAIEGIPEKSNTFAINRRYGTGRNCKIRFSNHPVAQFGISVSFHKPALFGHSSALLVAGMNECLDMRLAPPLESEAADCCHRFGREALTLM